MPRFLLVSAIRSWHLLCSTPFIDSAFYYKKLFSATVGVIACFFTLREGKMIIADNVNIKIPSYDSVDLPIIEEIPQVLKERNQWVLWKYAVKTSKTTGEKKITKVPYQANGSYAKSNNPETWGSFETVYQALTTPKRRFHGIGFVFSNDDNFVGVDIDHVYDPETQEWNNEALEEVNKLNSYAEMSPSGTGAHVITIGDKPAKNCKKGNWEMYQALRYFTFTGNRIPGTPEDIREAREALKDLYNKKLKAEEEEGDIKKLPKVTRKTKAAEAEKADIEIINKCSSKGGKFTSLFNGTWEDISKQLPEYPTPSEADQALLTLIASETQDLTQIKRVFQESARYRPEKGKDYLTRSVKNAAEHVKRAQKEKELNPERNLHPFYIIPSGVVYLSDKGEEKTIIRAKTEITGISDNLDIDPEDTENNRYTHYRIKTGNTVMFVSHGELLTRAGIIKLISSGMMAAEGDSKLINNFFLLDMEHALKHSDRLFVCYKPGWKRNKSLFVSGNFAYSVEGAQAVNLLDKNSQNMYDCKGTLEDWKHPSLLTWIGYDTARVCCYVAVSGILSSYLGLPNIIVSITGRTTGGKTTSASAAGSMIGRAYGGEFIVRSANITQAAAEKLSISINGHFLVLDETKTNKDYESLIYMLANGRPKGRAPNSTLEESEGFTASYIFTGESELLKDTVAQGANGRLITLVNKIPKTSENAEYAKDIAEVIQENYGHIKELFINKMMEQKENLHKRYRELSKEFRDEDKDIGARIGDSIACICLAGELLEEVFKDIGVPEKDCKALCETVMEENITSEQKQEYWLRGLEIVYNEISTWQNFKDIEGGIKETLIFRGTVGGKDTAEYLNISESAIKKICQENNLDKTELVKVWKEKGITLTDNTGKEGKERYCKTVKIEGKPVKCISFKKEKLEKELGIDKKESWGSLRRDES